MDRSKQLILSKGKDITSDVKSYEYNPSTKKYSVTFQSGKTYLYNPDSIEFAKNPEVLDPTNIRIIHLGKELYKIQALSVFHTKSTDYWYVQFSNDKEKTYNFKDLKVLHSCLSDTQSQDCLNYLKQLASINELQNDNGEVLLQKVYEKLKFVGTNTAMASYMNPKEHKIHIYNIDDLIFPFGGNSSQFKAVTNALSNQISIIQGPPGTGKTQTILNIIANLLISEKTIQIVSNNNFATSNISDKLSNSPYNLGFLIAFLGNYDNKKTFINRQTGTYPELDDWKLDTNQQSELKIKIQNHVKELSTAFSTQERIAQARTELNLLKLEMEHFKRYCSEAGLIYPEPKSHNHLNIEKVMELWQECCKFSERERAVSFWFKIKSTYIYSISDWSLYKNDILTIITFIQSLFYYLKQLELENEIDRLGDQLLAINAKDKMAELTEWSMSYLRAKLFERYGGKKNRILFSKDDLWKSAGKVVEEYPIILSTTFASCSSLEGIVYDYLIMDEASQVDIATGALSLSCAKNAVIVGDLKQLPNVVSSNLKKRSDEIFNSYKLSRGYSYSENSFLKSVCDILCDAPQTLLREHYRCHPKIIEFCNQKFYNNELIIMTEDSDELDTLKVFKTQVGDHKRKHINQRQIDVTIKDVLPTISEIDPDKIGIIAPYNEQVNTIIQQLDACKIDVATVHKFQGREKDMILLTTVDDVVTAFSDDPCLLNVAISRAKKQLYLVVSGNEQPVNSNIGDLIAYINYNKFDVIQSNIRSVFDLLYRQYTDARIAFLKKYPHKMKYISENLMYVEIREILKEYPNLLLNVVCHQQLNTLIKNPNLMSDEERRYAMNPSTHIDFLIYSKIRKEPVLAIEVDGFNFHKPGTKQYERDKLKNNILKLYNIPLLRFLTNGSEECIKIKQFLDSYA